MISIRNSEVERLARELAGRTGKTMTDAILDALIRTRADDAEQAGRRAGILRSIAAACAAAPDLDTRSPDEILGYDEAGGFGDGGR